MFFSRLKVALFFRLPPLSDRVWWEIGGRSRPNIQTIFALPRRYRHRQQQLNNNLSSIYLAMFSAINIFQREDPAARRSSKVLTPYSSVTHTHRSTHTRTGATPTWAVWWWEGEADLHHTCSALQAKLGAR